MEGKSKEQSRKQKMKLFATFGISVVLLGVIGVQGFFQRAVESWKAGNAWEFVGTTVGAVIVTSFLLKHIFLFFKWLCNMSKEHCCRIKPKPSVGTPEERRSKRASQRASRLGESLRRSSLGISALLDSHVETGSVNHGRIERSLKTRSQHFRRASTLFPARTCLQPWSSFAPTSYLSEIVQVPKWHTNRIRLCSPVSGHGVSSSGQISSNQRSKVLCTRPSSHSRRNDQHLSPLSLSIQQRQMPGLPWQWQLGSIPLCSPIKRSGVSSGKAGHTCIPMT